MKKLKLLLAFTTIVAIIIFSCNVTKNTTEVAGGKTWTMPYNKTLTPLGKLVFFGDSALENHALDVALSPDKKFLAVEHRYGIVFLDTKTNKIVYNLFYRRFPKYFRLKNTYSGITWFTNNDLLCSTQKALLKVHWNGQKAQITKAFFFKPENGAKRPIPNAVLVQKENGQNIAYLVLNGNDQLVKINLDNDSIIWTKTVGLAPYGITSANGLLYISDWSGYAPTDDSQDSAGIPWGEAIVNKFGAVATGCVSVINPKNGQLIQNIKTGLHPNDIITSPDQKFIYVANANDDNVSVIQTSNNQVVETIPIRLNKQKNPYFGDSPDGLAISSDGKTLYVSAGMDNAIAVVKLGKKASSNSSLDSSTIIGFIPTAAYPGGITLLGDSILYVANIEGIGARLTVQDTNYKPFSTFFFPVNHSTAGAYNTHRMLACISIIPLPDENELPKLTEQVIKNNNHARLALLDILPRKNVKPVPVPKNIGEPSVFKHVIYIIKENRTYDQVLGDVKKGNGDPSLCIFGKKITPNIHKLVNEYVLLDNYKASGKCSAEGHVWTDAGMVTDYIERNVRGWFRSYTHVLYDAMAYPKTGFLWDNALDHGKTVRIYGEAAIPVWKGKKTWSDIYNDFLAGKPFIFTNKTTIRRVRAILSPTYPGYDSHNIPDILRAKAFIDELHAYEQMPGDSLPDLIIMALPNDHTALASPGHPKPRAMVADNDYALGLIVQAITHSKFWKNTVIFVTEDDSQNGWDHVSAYRTVGLVISPYTRTGKTISTDYNQTSMLRTIEQILGLPPMNIEDATATPMFDVFDTVPDYTPYTAIKNQIPLDEMNPPLSKLKGKAKKRAKVSLQIIQKGIDGADDDLLLNKILWALAKPHQKYPYKYSGKDDDDRD